MVIIIHGTDVYFAEELLDGSLTTFADEYGDLDFQAYGVEDYGDDVAYLTTAPPVS